ncbi:hypothetical protein [Chitinibacter sp. GC72]|uniref:hypothetical protein n=1 Tax=Chitinibacter sp. GC72 TaxID=1526917 RepID=UPI0012F79F21|nr:hypothetical protein [Chitinibacter sp. GC72]
MASIRRRTFMLLLAALPLSRVWAMSGFLYRPGLRAIQGSVKINGSPATEGMPVSWGDTVETGVKSSAVFVLGKDAFLLRENSRVQLGLEAASRFIRLQTGKLLSVFGPGEKTLETQAVTLGIRGTGCYLEAEGAGTYVCLCYGHAILTPKAAPEQMIEYKTMHHDKPYWVEGAQVRPGGVRNHTDAELTMLEALLGRKPPFSSSDQYRY